MTTNQRDKDKQYLSVATHRKLMSSTNLIKNLSYTEVLRLIPPVLDKHSISHKVVSNRSHLESGSNLQIQFHLPYNYDHSIPFY